MSLRSLTAWCVCALLLAVLANAGCRRRDPYMDAYIAFLNAEKRDLEDEVLKLESELQQAQSDLDAARARTPRTRNTPSGAAKPDATVLPKMMDDTELTPPIVDHGLPVEPHVEMPPAATTPRTVPPKKPAPPIKTMKPQEVIPDATIEPVPEPTPMPDLGPVPDPATDAEPPNLERENLPAPKANDLPFRKRPADAEVVDPQVSHLFVNPFHTTGVDLDQQPGDDALRVMIEPRNEAGQFIPQAGEMAVVLLDPAKSGDDARIARWDLTKQRVGEGLLEARPDRGIKLELPWPEKAPDNGKLKLFVRYTDTAGQVVETTSDVFISVAGQLSQRWTPAKK
jgi:hypothetical protein